MTSGFTYDTLEFGRRINASPSLVFAAWQDPEARTIWGPPSNQEALEFVQTDFQEGGVDLYRCGQKGDLRFNVEAQYHSITPHQLLFTERVMLDSSLLSLSLISVSMNEKDLGTDLKLTVQITSTCGSSMIDGNRNGWQAALVNLAKYVE